jgi:hypothetical protein
MEIDMTTYWYRYEDARYAGGCDESGDPIPGEAYSKIHLRTFKVIGETPKGVWLSFDGVNKSRWVSHSSRKRFACATKQEAIVSFIARKKKQQAIYTAKAKIAEDLIRKARKEFYTQAAYGTTTIQGELL